MLLCKRFRDEEKTFDSATGQVRNGGQEISNSSKVSAF